MRGTVYETGFRKISENAVIGSVGGGIKNVPCMVDNYVCLLDFRKISGNPR